MAILVVTEKGVTVVEAIQKEEALIIAQHALNLYNGIMRELSGANNVAANGNGRKDAQEAKVEAVNEDQE